MDKGIVIELNSTKYLMFEVPVTERLAEDVEENVCLYDGIIQSIKRARKGLLGGTYAVCNVLIPENNAVAFSRAIYG